MQSGGHIREVSAQSATLRIAAIQFLFTVTWIIYAIYYGDLLAAVGLDRSWVVTIFILDQLVFALMDPLMGAWADKVEASMRSLAPWVIALNLLAAGAFIALPVFAEHLPNLPALLLLATFVWVVSASVLRAPLFVMLDRLPGAPDQTTRIAQAAAGIAIGAALAPFIGLWLKGMSPFIPFLLSSVTLAVAGLSLPSIPPRAASASGPDAAPAPDASAAMPRRSILWLFVLTLLLACGFQFHFFVASAALYRRFVEAADLPWLMPVFWVGFNLALIPATRLIHRHGAGWMLRVGSVIGSAALLLCLYAPSLPWLVLGQCVLGACWGAAFIAGLRAVNVWPRFMGAALGRMGNGLALGGWFCMLSLAAAGRISLDKVFKVDAMTLETTALACWVLASVVAWILFSQRERHVAA